MAPAQKENQLPGGLVRTKWHESEEECGKEPAWLRVVLPPRPATRFHNTGCYTSQSCNPTPLINFNLTSLEIVAVANLTSHVYLFPKYPSKYLYINKLLYVTVI